MAGPSGRMVKGVNPMRKGKRERLAQREHKAALAYRDGIIASLYPNVVASASRDITRNSHMRFDPINPVGKQRPDWASLSPIRGMRNGQKWGASKLDLAGR